MDFMKFAGGNHYYEEIKLLHLGEIRKEQRYSIREKITID